MARGSWIVVPLLFACLAGCGGPSDGGQSQSSSNSSGGTTVRSVTDLAMLLGCSDFHVSSQTDTHANADASCLFNGKTLTLVTFDDTTQEQAWIAAGPQTADNRGTIVVGTGWTVALFDASQATAVQQAVGGTVQQMGH